MREEIFTFINQIPILRYHSTIEACKFDFPSSHPHTILPSPLKAKEEKEGEEEEKKLLANSRALLIFIISSISIGGKFMLYIFSLPLPQRLLSTMENHLFALTVLPLIPNLVYLFILFFLHFAFLRSPPPHHSPALSIILRHEKERKEDFTPPPPPPFTTDENLYFYTCLLSHLMKQNV